MTGFGARSVVVLEPFGRNSNRLVQNLHFHAYCLENGFALANPTLEELRPLLAEPPPIWPGRRNRIPPRWYRSLAWRGVWGPVVHFGQTGVEFPPLETFRVFRTVFVSGWHFRVPELVQKHGHELRRRYSFRSELYSEHPDYLTLLEIRSKRPTIGVHVRRGDYREWRGGRYYYDDSVYEGAVEHLAAELRDEKGMDPSVCVFSDEPLTLARRSALPARERPWYIDQVLMGECDYLLGPPSTFSRWASFIGRARLGHLHSAEHRPGLSELRSWADPRPE